jgi:hypothetical protein
MNTTTDHPAPAPKHEFFGDLARILNAGQARGVVLHGNVHDLFYIEGESGARGQYVSLIEYLCRRSMLPGLIVMVYELNGPIRLVGGEGWDKIKSGWIAWKAGVEFDQLILQSLADRNRQAERRMLEDEFGRNVYDAIGKPTVALEFLRQLSLCSRATDQRGRPFIPENLLMIIEAADMLLPAGDGDIARLNATDRHRVSILQDWLSDPGFLNGGDSVVMMAESRSHIHPRVARLPQVLAVEVPSPDRDARHHYYHWFTSEVGRPPVSLSVDPQQLVMLTAGLSIHALRQMLMGAAHSARPLTHDDIIGKVASFIETQLGEDVVEFKKPSHTLKDVIGFTRLKQFIREELIPRFQAGDNDALPGAAVAGPIGGGKTFIFEAVAAELGMPVLVLKNIRSQWFGQTDVIFERLRRVLEALGKALIFVDEADTQFGNVGPSAHDTERRLTGKIQQMMSDTALRGKVIWLLMTARIHLLSPDIRRPGRVGDLIIPVLDPTGDDRKQFIAWVLKAALKREPADHEVASFDQLTPAYSAAAFASLRSRLKAQAASGAISFADLEAIIRDHLPPAIERARQYQTLQALVNCTRRSLLPNPDVTDEQREQWQLAIHRLERAGIP